MEGTRKSAVYLTVTSQWTLLKNFNMLLQLMMWKLKNYIEVPKSIRIIPIQILIKDEILKSLVFWQILSIL
jgi:hypothetical protein